MGNGLMAASLQQRDALPCSHRRHHLFCLAAIFDLFDPIICEGEMLPAVYFSSDEEANVFATAAAVVVPSVILLRLVVFFIFLTSVNRLCPCSRASCFFFFCDHCRGSMSCSDASRWAERKIGFEFGTGTRGVRFMGTVCDHKDHDARSRGKRNRKVRRTRTSICPSVHSSIRAEPVALCRRSCACVLWYLFIRLARL